MPSELTTTYLGIELQSPVIVGSCPLTVEPETVRQLVAAGAGAIVLPSILQEQILYADMNTEDRASAISQSGYQPQQDKHNGGVENYLRTIRELKDKEQVPIIASIAGASSGSWFDYAKRIEASGADALELNRPPTITLPHESADQVENQLCDMVRRICESISIPIAVKLNQRFTNLASIAHKLKDAGAAGVVLFTHTPRWDINVDRMNWTIGWQLSPIDSLSGTLEGIVRTRAGGLDLSIAASGGIRTSEDAIKTIIAGADVGMVTSEIYREGPGAVRRIVEGVSRFLDSSHYKSLLAFQRARPTIEIGPDRLMRLEYVDPLERSDHYHDLTVPSESGRGDSFGHKLD